MSVIYCRSHDEVNIDLARSWCDENDLDFQLADRRDELFPDEAGALAIDLNHLGLVPSERAELVERLGKVLLPYPVAIASYEIDHVMVKSLGFRGALLFRGLGKEMFHDVAKAMARARGGFAA